MSTTSFCPVAFLKPLFSWDADTEPGAAWATAATASASATAAATRSVRTTPWLRAATDGTVSRAGHEHGGARSGLQACLGPYSTRSVVRLLIVLLKTTIPKRLILNG